MAIIAGNLCPAVCSLLTTISSAHGAAGVISTEEICDYLAAQQRALKESTVHFDVAHYFGRGSRVPPKGGPRPEHLVYSAICSTILHGDNYRLQKTYTATNANLRALLGADEIMTWDGAEARSVKRYPDESSAELFQIDAKPPKTHYMELYLTWQGWWVLQFPERLSYADLLHSDGVVGPELLPDERTRWRCPFQDVPITEMEIVIVAKRVKGEIELSEVELRFYKDPTKGKDDENLRVSHRVTFGTTRKDSGQLLPSTATLIQSHRRENPADEFWMVTEVALRSVERSKSITDQTFREPIGPVATVVDSRLRIAYRIGEKALNLDGRLLETHEPVHGDVGANLEWWVAHGKLAPLRDPETGRFVTEQGDPEGMQRKRGSSLWRPGVIIASVVIAFIILRSRRSSG